ncbi:hypothetical protein DHD32_22155 [Arenibacter sp. TNZ]|uniref:hypothetical protein n=1 Tax=Arenibacter TaxID=178469 RepID=UPI000CD3E163|nr:MULTISPECIES: hypothetical protein [Arenibacter]MCM4174174.1 hypothetical protein [Arenibacter sp. TNZ]
MKGAYKILLVLLVIITLLLIVFFVPESKKELRTKNFTFLFSSSIDSLSIVELSKALEDSYTRVSNNMNTKPADNIQVNIYPHRWRYVKATGNWNASGSIEGTSKLHFLENTWMESDIAKIAVHEFVHAVFLKLLLDSEKQPLNPEKFDEKFSKYPIWLWEGVSTYEANQFYDPKTLAYFDGGRYPQISELNVRTKGQKIYTCGYTIVEYILEEYGRNKLIELIKSYGDLETVLGVSEKQFSKDWYQFMDKKYLN